MSQKLYKFEVVQTVDGQPDPMGYEEGLSYTPRYSGAAKVVYMSFEDDEEASKQAVEHVYGPGSIVWEKHCPPIWKHGDGSGGLDVFYIGPCTEEEEKEVRASLLKVLYHHPDTTPEIVHLLTGQEFGGVPDVPSEREHGLFRREVDEIVSRYFESLDEACIEVTGESLYS